MTKKSKFIFALVFPVIIIAGCAISPDPDNSQSAKASFRVGTYNVRDMFDDVDDPEKSDDPATDPDRLKALAEVILTSECDILAVQEVENLDELTMFNSVYLEEYYSSVTLLEGNDPRGIDVGILSNFDSINVRSYRDREFEEGFTGSTIKFSRDLIAIRFYDDSGREWNLLTTHLKAGGGGHNSIRRQAQVEEITRIIREENYVDSFGRGLTILAGDLNAEPWTEELDALTDVPFSDPGRDMPSRATHASGKTYDYILLSPDADARYVVGSYTIFADEPSERASDHRLVYVDLYE